jgi:hypothetical protein
MIVAVGQLAVTPQHAKEMEERYNKLYKLYIQKMKRRQQNEYEE